MENIEQTAKLPDGGLPLHRMAYSDRIAWLMACLSEIAYVNFNELANGGFVKELHALLGSKPPDLRLIKTFSTEGTQAILVGGEQFYALVFRGTEKTSFQDIKTDLKAKLSQCKGGGKIHTGFQEAYNLVAQEIQEELGKLSPKPLFLSGHSLGGALATVAAKNLSYSGKIATCYTFGAPRVGDEDWVHEVKTQIYRVVNAIDVVTMIPGSSVSKAIIWCLKFLGRFSKLLGRWGKWASNNYGYANCGDMRYLTNCSKGKYDQVKLLYGQSSLARIRRVDTYQTIYKKFLSDHSITIYRQKLKIIAQRRN